MNAIADPQAAPTAQLCALLKASADPLRLEILRVLARESYGVRELCQVFDIRQPAMSHHLKVLSTTGLVATRREGNSIFYRRHHQPPASRWEPLWTTLLAAVDALPLRPEVQASIAAVQRERAQSSRQFFEDNAQRLRAQQELIASYPEYAGPVVELLDSAPASRAMALELGPGEGAFLAELAPRFQRVVAVDISEAMLRVSRELARDKQLENVEFIHGDSSSALAAGLNPDCVIANMVLHHTPSPAEMLTDIGRLLTPGGTLLLAELCRHDQAWARDACGDLWLGFDPADITRWAGEAGLREDRQLYFAQRNGFSVQVRQFMKPEAAPQGPSARADLIPS